MLTTTAEELAVPVVVLCGLWTPAVTEVADRLLAEHPELRRQRYGAAEPVGLPDGHRLTVAPEGYEPDEIRRAWRGAGAPHIVTAVPADLLLDGLTDERTLRAAGLRQASDDERIPRTAGPRRAGHDEQALPAAGPRRASDDERSIGELVARQLEQADTVVLTAEPDDEWDAEQIRTLVRRIAPWSRHPGIEAVPISVAGRPEPVAAATRGLRGYAVGDHHPVADHGVVACVFHARRPFHPGRLHDALDEITEGVLRSRGTFWLASRPDVAMTWESADGLAFGAHSGWLAEHWSDVDPERCLAAAVDWDPYYGDRGQRLAFVGLDFDPVRLHRTLTGCLLTDAELADGSDSWARLPDPFERCFRLVTTEEQPR